MITIQMPTTLAEAWQGFKDIFTLVMTIFSVYMAIKNIIIKSKSKIVSGIVKMISTAEDETALTGPEKMEMVIQYAKGLVPRLFKVLFTDKIVEEMSQNIYDDMQAYREKYMKNRTGMSTAEVIKMVEEVNDPGAAA